MSRTRYERVQARVYEIVEAARPGDRWSKRFDWLLTTIIVISVASAVVETVPTINAKFGHFLAWIELVSVILFTIEYAFRFWSCRANDRYRSPLLGRLRYAVSPMAILDLLAILPFYLPLAIPLDLRVLRVARLARMLRMFKMARYSESLRILGRVLVARSPDLMMTFLAAILILLVASTMMYAAENQVQPDKFPSVVSAMWWSVSTLTTVGYGDVYPITPVGKLLGALVAFLGVGMFALPAGILGSGFVEEMQKRRSKKNRCPHCGGEL